MLPDLQQSRCESQRIDKVHIYGVICYFSLEMYDFVWTNEELHTCVASCGQCHTESVSDCSILQALGYLMPG